MDNVVSEIRENLNRVSGLVSSLSQSDSNFRKEIENSFTYSSAKSRIDRLDNIINYFLNSTQNKGLDIPWQKLLLGFHLSEHGRNSENYRLIKHSYNVAKLSYILGKRANKELGLEVVLGDLYVASFLHDIGHIFTPVDIYTSTERFNEKERLEHFEKHTMYSDIICYILGVDEIPMVLNVVNYHHERFDGSGYPEKLEGDEIPIGPKIVAITDLYDALRSKRAYKPSFSAQESINIMNCPDVTQRTNYKQFDPNLLQLFIDSKTNKLVERFVYNNKLNI